MNVGGSLPFTVRKVSFNFGHNPETTMKYLELERLFFWLMMKDIYSLHMFSKNRDCLFFPIP